MLRNPGLRKSVEQPVLDLNFAASQIGSNGAPDSRIDFSRGTYAWFVDSDGLVKKSLAARLDHDPTWFMSAAQEQNLLQYSEAINDSYWTKTRTTVTANALEAPDGTVTAELLSEDTSSNNTHILRQATPADVPQTAGKSYVFSGYLKAGGRHRARIRFESSAHQADIDLTAGTITNNGFSSVSLTDEGNGWFRFAGVQTADATNDPLIQIMLRNDSGLTSYAGDGSSGLYVWGLQLEVGTSPSTYHRTEGAPYYGEGATPKGLLIEEARTNLAPNSDNFVVSNEVTRSADAHLAPDGTITADEFTITTANQSHQFGGQLLIGSLVTVGTVHAVSFFAKLINGTPNLAVRGFGKGGFNQHPIFDLSNGTVVNVGSSWESGTSIEDFGNGWFRCKCIVNPSAQFNLQIHMLESGDTTGVISFAGNGTDKVAVWGVQLEVGSFVTSHIATTGTSLTRNADVAVMGPTTGGTELVTNGTFDTDSDWNDNGEGTIGISGGKLTFASTAQFKNANQFLVPKLVAGRRYRASFDVTSYTSGSLKLQYREGSGNTLIAETTGTSAVVSGKSFDFTCSDAAVNKVQILATGSGTTNTYEVDNVSVRELYPFEHYNPAEGTVLFEANVPHGMSSYGAFFNIADDGVYTDRISIVNNDTNSQLYTQVRSGGTTVFNTFGNSVSYTLGQNFRVALAYAASDFASTVDANTVRKATSGAVPPMDSIKIGIDAGNATPGSFHARRVRIFPKRLPDTILQSLTSD